MGMAFIIAGLVALAGIVAFLIIGLPLLRKLGTKAGGLFMPGDSGFRVKPEYSTAEARVKQGRYPEAVGEYRKVIELFPDDVFAHVRLAEVALEHLHDRQMAEAELIAALEKTEGEDALVLVAHRLADFYHQTCDEPQRAIPVLETLRSRLKTPKQIQLTDERLAVLRRFAAGEKIPPTPTKISPGKSQFKLDKDSRTRI